MKIIVCIKQVPGTTQVEVDPVTGVLKRDGVDSKLNPYDLYAIETALGLSNGGGVTVLTMGPAQAEEILLEAVYMGADKGVLVSDRRFSGADVLATAYTLSQAVGVMDGFDLILCGKQTTDGDTAQVGAELAEFLQIPHANNVIGIEAEEGGVIVQMNQDHHIVRQKMPMPCLICVDGEINTPRLPSYLRKRNTVEKPIEVISLNEMADQDAGHYGLDGSPTQVERVFQPEKNEHKELYQGSAKQLSKQLYETLKAGKYL